MTKMGDRYTKTASLKTRLALHADKLRSQAQAMPPGPGRDELMKKVQQVEAAAGINEWLGSP